jgi:hypothetical protein
MADTVEEMVREDHEKMNAKFNSLELMTQVFDRGSEIFALQKNAATDEVKIRHGIINSMQYYPGKGEMVFNVRADETKPIDFIIGSKTWLLFPTKSALYTYLDGIFENEEIDQTGLNGSSNTNTETQTQG